MLSKSFVAYACLFGFTTSINAQAAVLGSEGSLVHDDIQRSLHANYPARRAFANSEAPVVQSSVKDFEDVKASLVDGFTATPLPTPRDVAFLSNVIGGDDGPVPFPPPNDDDSPSQEATAQIASQDPTALPPPPPPATVNFDPPPTPTPSGGIDVAFITAAAPQTTALIVAQNRAVDPLLTLRDDQGFPGNVIGGHNDNNDPNYPFIPPNIVDPFPTASQESDPTAPQVPSSPTPSGGVGGAPITAAAPQTTVLIVGRNHAVDPLPTPRDDDQGFPGNVIGGHNDNNDPNYPFLPPNIIDPFPTASQESDPTAPQVPSSPTPSGGVGGAPITAAAPQTTVLIVGRNRAAPQVRAAEARAANANRRSANSERTWSSRRSVNLS